MVKRATGLFDAICEPGNLRLAFYKAARGKYDRKEVRTFRADFHNRIQIMQDQLVSGCHELGNYRFFTLYDPKKRLICAAPFTERVLHHAVMNVCEPVLERYAIYDSYACRKGKGLHAALARTQYFSRTSPWFLKLDIHKYFDSIDHDIVLRLLRRKIKDRRVLDLFATLVAAYNHTPGKGLPIGSLVSQHLANFYLGLLDHWLKDELGIRGYLRYMDDFLLFAASREQARQLLHLVRSFLAETLRLQLHEQQHLRQCCQGIPLLGFSVFPGIIRLNKGSRSRFSRKFRQYEQQYWKGKWDFVDLDRHMNSLIGFTLPADSLGLRNMIIDRYGVLSEEV